MPVCKLCHRPFIDARPATAIVKAATTLTDAELALPWDHMPPSEFFTRLVAQAREANRLKAMLDRQFEQEGTLGTKLDLIAGRDEALAEAQRLRAELATAQSRCRLLERLLREAPVSAAAAKAYTYEVTGQTAEARRYIDWFAERKSALLE